MAVKFPHSCSLYATGFLFALSCQVCSSVLGLERSGYPPRSSLIRMIETSLHCDMKSLQNLSSDCLLNTAGTHYVGFSYCKKNVKLAIHSQAER